MTPILRGQDLIDRGRAPGAEFSAILGAARRAQRDRVFRTPEEAAKWLDDYLAKSFSLLTGQDLLDRGLEPGPAIGRILKEARELQARRELTTREEALAWLDRRLTSAE